MCSHQGSERKVEKSNKLTTYIRTYVQNRLGFFVDVQMTVFQNVDIQTSRQKNVDVIEPN
jgi:hypothetical protein